MTASTNQLTPDIRAIEIDGTRYLGVRISESESNRSAKRFIEDGLAPGYVVHGEEIETWKPAGLKEIDGTVFLYGPYFDGRTIERITEHQAETAMEYFSRLAKCLEAIHGRDLPLPRIQTNGILFLDDGGLLILPPIILERLRNVQIDADRVRTFEIYNHPDLTGEQAVVFSLGVIWYRIATGELPFIGEDEVDLHHRMRELRPVAPRLKNPEVTDEASDLIESAVDFKRDEPVSLAELTEAIDRTKHAGMFASVSEERRASLAERALQVEKRRSRRYVRKRFLRKHGRVLAWSAIGIAVVGTFAGSIITNLTRPRVVLDMEPPEIVELFYESITTLDHQAIEDCLADGVGREEINEATNLFVLSRVRLGNEGTTGLVAPHTWYANDMPQLNETLSVYGIDSLRVTQLSETRFVAEYRKWEQLLTETMAYRIPEANATVRERRDVLTFAYDGTYWLITDIDREVDRYLDRDEFVALDESATAD